MIVDPLDRLERLEVEATVWPWSPATDDPLGVHPFQTSGDGQRLGLHPTPVARATIESDAALIAESRNALPALLKVARAAREVAQGGPCWYVVEHGGPPCPPDEPGCDACTLRAALASLDALDESTDNTETENP